MSRAEHAKHQNIEATIKGDPIKEGPPCKLEGPQWVQKLKNRIVQMH